MLGAISVLTGIVIFVLKMYFIKYETILSKILKLEEGSSVTTNMRSGPQ